VWVTNNHGETVSRIDPAEDRVVQPTPVGNAPAGRWRSATGRDGTLTRIDALTGAVAGTIAVGAGVSDVAVGAGAVWVSDAEERASFGSPP
jgi:DNA-binding beta-propeller fold protein YncE